MRDLGYRKWSRLYFNIFGPYCWRSNTGLMDHTLMQQGTSYSSSHSLSENSCPNKLNSTRVWYLGCRTKKSTLLAIGY